MKVRSADTLELLGSVEFDVSPAIMELFYDEDTGLAFLAAKVCISLCLGVCRLSSFYLSISLLACERVWRGSSLSVCSSHSRPQEVWCGAPVCVQPTGLSNRNQAFSLLSVRLLSLPCMHTRKRIQHT